MTLKVVSDRSESPVNVSHRDAEDSPLEGNLVNRPKKHAGAADGKEMKNLRKNLIGGWIFAALGSLALVKGLIDGRVSLLWVGLGVLGAVFALRSGRRLKELKSAPVVPLQTGQSQSHFTTFPESGR